MKIMVRVLEERIKKFSDVKGLPDDWKLVFTGFERDTEKLLAVGGDADAIFVDAVEPVTGELIRRMPNLRIIHSEGAGYDQIDLQAAAERNIYVCNNRGANAKAVAEHTVMLILAVLRRIVEGDRMVREARQLEAKSSWILQGIRDLSGLRTGIIGMGNIGRETVKRLLPFETKISYYNRTRLSKEEEAALSVEYRPLSELLATCDIISLHLASNVETRDFMNKERFALMKNDAILINTARGELVNQEDLSDALSRGKIAGAGLDCLSPEPVMPDNVLLNLPEEIRYKVTFSPHIGGVTVDAFKRMHATAWSNIQAVAEGSEPRNVVNGVMNSMNR